MRLVGPSNAMHRYRMPRGTWPWTAAGWALDGSMAVVGLGGIPSESINRSIDRPTPQPPHRLTLWTHYIHRTKKIGVQKLDNKTLTGRYDMKQLIKVQQVRSACERGWWRPTKLIDRSPRSIARWTAPPAHTNQSIPYRMAQVEQWFMTKLVELYGVEDEDALPINFDLLEVMETPKDKRPDFLKEKLAGCPKGTYIVRLRGVRAGGRMRGRIDWRSDAIMVVPAG